MKRSDLADFAYFLAIARHRSFRKAGLEFGVTASAVSHSLKSLEERLGVRLLNRTYRSVTLTAAGEELQASIGRPFDEIAQAVDGLNRFRDTPAGHVRLNVVVDAVTVLLAPIMSEFADAYPGVELDIVASNRMVDVVGEGFDAGIRYGGTVPEDMIAQRLSADLRWIVVAAPSYLERRGEPTHPEQLREHRCLGVRLGDDRLYNWEFEGRQGEFDVPVASAITGDDSRSTLWMAIHGAGLSYGLEAVFAPHLASGELRQVLSDWSTVGEGFHIYYSSRRQVPTGLRLLTELIRERRPLGL